MCGLWWSNRHWGWFCLSSSISPASSHFTNVPYLVTLIIRVWYNRPVSGRWWPSGLSLTPQHEIKKWYIFYLFLLGTLRVKWHLHFCQIIYLWFSLWKNKVPTYTRAYTALSGYVQYMKLRKTKIRSELQPPNFCSGSFNYMHFTYCHTYLLERM
jgi:hypothetical protein